MKKKMTVAVCILAALVVFCGGCTLSTRDGLVDADDGATYYYVDGKMQTGWQITDSGTYYFSEQADAEYAEGAAYTGLCEIDGYRYYFDADGKMQTGWKKVDGSRYYFARRTGDGFPRGAAYTGIQWIDDNCYDFDLTGVMQTGWQTVDGSDYLFKKDASSTIPHGATLTGLHVVDGYRYYFDESARMQTGWQTIGDNTYYFEETASDDFPAGAALTGLQAVSDLYYYFDSVGRMQTGWLTISDKTYYFKQTASDESPQGAALTGLWEMDGSKYYFDETGVMQTGGVEVNGVMLYFNSEGQMVRNAGWKTINGNKYYYDPDTAMPVTGWQTIAGYDYYFNQGGILQTNRIVGSESGGYYYVGSDGIRCTSQEITYAVQFVMDHTTTDQTTAEKLKTCYNYLWKNYPYTRTYETPDASTMSDEAIAIFKNKTGNCYKYGAAFACIAKVLGYTSRVCVGQIHSRSGGMTPHGWCQIYQDGDWLYCDPDMQMNYPSRNVYMVTKAQYPYTHSITTTYQLTISNGEVSWT